MSYDHRRFSTCRLSLLFCGLLILGFMEPLSAQVMWPGDANNNGKVNAVDFLFVGLAYNTKGPVRNNASTNWQAQNFTAWSQFFANGLNYAYADGNGDGEINEKDSEEAIEANFGLTHGPLSPDGFSKGQKGIAPQLKLSTAQRIVAPGSTVLINLDLGDADRPVDFYGMAVQMGYTRTLVKSSDFEDEVAPWYDAIGEDAKDFYLAPNNTGRAELAVTRIDQQSVNGYGRIGKVKLVIEDIIVGRQVDTLRITIDSVRLINKNLRTTAVAHDTLVLFVTNNPALVGTKELLRDPALLQISPNPSQGDFWVKTPLPIAQWILYDPLGRAVPIQIQTQGLGQWRIQTRVETSGLYWLRGTGNQGFICKPILLTHSY